eukprot:759129-Hanusia_phi.AAC.8
MRRRKRTGSGGCGGSDRWGVAGSDSCARSPAPLTCTQMERAAKIGVERMIGVSGSLEDSRESLEAAKKFSNIFCTVGVHPTRCDEFEQSGDPEGHIRALCQVVEEGKDKVVAIGEIGLDYDREQFCSRDVQKKYFARQLQLAKTFHLPVIFHNRNTGVARDVPLCLPVSRLLSMTAGGDFEKIVQEHRQEFSTVLRLF